MTRLVLAWLLAIAAVGARDHREARHLRFLVFGDSGTGKAEQYEVGRRMAEECRARGGCDFSLMLGDNFYGGDLRPAHERDGALVFDRKFAERFEKPYEPIGAIDFWAWPGNHDWGSRAEIETQIAYTSHSPRWRMPALDYAVPLLPAWLRIYGLDTSSLTRGRDPSQIERARAALCGGDGWKILAGHYPVYGSGWHGNSRGEYPKAGEPLLEPLIERCGVQFYLSGHEHQQEHLTAPAFEQIVQGAAGKLREVRSVERRPPGVEQLAAASLYGFGLVEATADSLEIRFYGYSATRPWSAWHCRSYRLADFADRERRSHDCAPPASSE